MAIAKFADLFAEPDFSPGTTVPMHEVEPGVFTFGWWDASPIAAQWAQALYEHHIIDAESDYLSEATSEMRAAIHEDISLINHMGLAELRTVITLIARAERHTGGGPYEHAFSARVAQAATRRLGELAAEME